MAGSVLLIDADVQRLRSMGTALEKAGFEVLRELNADAALETYDRLEPEVVMLDFELPNGEEGGASPLRDLIERRATVLLTASDNRSDNAVRGLEEGAIALLVRPVPDRQLVAAALRGADYTRQRRLASALLDATRTTGGLTALGGSASMKRFAHDVGVLAKSDKTTVLLTGERGTEMQNVARLIHDLSDRARAPFISVRCTGLSASELDSALFGHEKGAHAEASRRRIGWFEIAHGGTVLLEGIESLVPVLQPKLLRVLETKTFRRMGGTKDIAVDVRLIAATSRDIRPEVDTGAFRKDLYYRLSVMELRVPPLRDRSDEDRAALVSRFLEAARARFPGAPSDLSPEALDRLNAYEWKPGNTAEMRNAIERAMMLALDRGHEVIEIADLAGELRARAGLGDRRHTPMTLDELERVQIERTLRTHDGNRTRSARELGISRATLINKIKRYNISA